MDWDEGNSVPFTLSLVTGSPTDLDTQSSNNIKVATALDSLRDPAWEFASQPEEEGGGGTRAWVAWLSAAAAVLVASIGYAAYRVLR